MKLEETTYIQVTRRKCSPALQKNVKVGGQYRLVCYDRTKDGTKVAVVICDGKESRINESRFAFSEFTLSDCVGEYNKRVKEEESARKEAASAVLKNALTYDEAVRVAFYPLFYYHLAWYYAMESHNFARRDKVDALRKLARGLRHVAEEYKGVMLKDLDFDHRKRLDESIELFVGRYSLDLMKLYFCVNNEFQRVRPNAPYADLHTYALMSMLIINAVDRYNVRMNELLQQKGCKTRENFRPQIIDKLYAIMNAYAGNYNDFRFDETNVSLAVLVIENRIREFMKSVTFAETK